MTATREANYSRWQGATAGPSGADVDLSRDTGVVARGAAGSGAVLSMALCVIVLIAGAGMAAILLLFMGQFALFTYLRPFLETVTKVDVTVLSLLLLAIGVAGLIGTSLIGPLLSSRLSRMLTIIPLGMAALALA